MFNIKALITTLLLMVFNFSTPLNHKFKHILDSKIEQSILQTTVKLNIIKIMTSIKFYFKRKICGHIF